MGEIEGVVWTVLTTFIVLSLGLFGRGPREGHAALGEQ